MSSGSASLVARINLDGENGVCALCNQSRERLPGMTETYLAGTEKWVCVDCAGRVDPELAAFAYRPELPYKRRFKRLGEELGYFGVCPECGDPGVMLNVRASHWIMCERHGLRWCVGWNLLSGWQTETEATWRRNAEKLLRCREVKGAEPRRTLWARMRVLFFPVVRWIRQAWRALFGPPAVEEEPPF